MSDQYIVVKANWRTGPSDPSNPAYWIPVNEKMSQGWIPVGAPFVYTGASTGWYQAMMKRAPPTTPPPMFPRSGRGRTQRRGRKN